MKSMSEYCEMNSEALKNVSTSGLIELKSLPENRSDQSIQNGEANFTALFQFSELPCPRLRCVGNGARVFGVRTRCLIYLKLKHSMRLAFSVLSLLFGFHFKQEKSL